MAVNCQAVVSRWPASHWRFCGQLGNAKPSTPTLVKAGREGDAANRCNTHRNMIIRALRLRHGRIALPKASTNAFWTPSRRGYSVEVESNERSQAPSFADSGPAIQPDVAPEVKVVPLHDPNHPVALDYAFLQHTKATTQHLGSTIKPYYRPHELLTNPPSPKDITLELLLASQAHIGHSTSLWHPANARYIFGIRGRKKDGEAPIHIISLETTAAHLRRACKIVQGVTERGGLVLFVGTRQGQARAVVKAAQMAKGCHLFSKWIPGSITNGQQILGRCGKKVVNEKDEEVEGFEDQLGAKAVLKPDLVVCLNPLENYVMLHECGQANIPTIGIVDTDCNPTWVTYPIPANDDSLRCVQVIAGVLGRAGQEGQRSRLDQASNGQVTYNIAHGLAPPTKRKIAEPKPQRRGRLAPAPVAPIADELYTETVETEQQLQDKKLLAEADKAMRKYSGWMSSEAEPEDAEEAPTTYPPQEEEEDDLEIASTSNLDSTEEEEAPTTYPPQETDDLSTSSSSSEDSPTIDKSLLDEFYGTASTDADVAEDLEQFGGMQQLYSSSKSTSSSEDSSDGLLPGVGEELQESASSSTMDQVEAVAEELGESQGEEAHADKSEPAGIPAEEGVSPTAATTESVEKEEAGDDREEKR